jgi:hypothetical protein
MTPPRKSRARRTPRTIRKMLLAAAALTPLLAAAGCAELPAPVGADVKELAAYRDQVYRSANTAYTEAPTEQARDERRLAYGQAAAAWNTVLHRTFINVVSGADMAYDGDAFQQALRTAEERTGKLLEASSGDGKTSLPAVDQSVLRLYRSYDTLDPSERDMLGRDLLELRWPTE